MAQLGLAAPVSSSRWGLTWESLIRSGSGEFRERYPELAGRRCVLFFRRVCEKKGVHLLIEAMAKVSDEKAMLVIAGPVTPEYRERLDEIVAQASPGGAG